MRCHTLLLAFLATCSTSSALKIPFTKTRQPQDVQRRSYGSLLATTSGSDNDTSSAGLSTINDMIYFVNVTLGGTDYTVQLDTGSSDLWIRGSTTPIPNSDQTSTTYNLTYGVGWAYGHVSYAPVEFSNISVSKQAFIDATSAQNPALNYGASGILGLGFTSLSTIDALVNQTGASTGRSLLYNLFADNPSEPNFIAFSLQRSTDSSDDIEGLFLVGEIDEDYAHISSSNAISTFPVNSPSRWTVLLDAYMVGTKTFPVSGIVEGSPSNRAVVLLDSGTSYSYAPTDVCESIYGSISGAQYDDSIGQWTVPCDAEVDMALQFGGEVFPIHPLDVTPKSVGDPTQCLGSFVPQDISEIADGNYDWIVGDNVLRSIYSLYDFGDFDSSGAMGNPYVKLLSLVDPNEASSEFAAARGSTARSNITYAASNSTISARTTVSLSDDITETLHQVNIYFPVLIAFLCLNALVMILLLVVGVMYLYRKRTKSSRPRKHKGRATPLPMEALSPVQDDDADAVSIRHPSQHVYQPVSMALTEDTFVPPSPAFHKYSDSLRPGPKKIIDRPYSMAYQPVSVAQADETFAPPSPAFHGYSDSLRPGGKKAIDRPNSVA